MNYNTNRSGNSLDTTKFSTHAERDALAVLLAFFSSGFGQADRQVRFGHWRVTPGAYPPSRAACQLTDYARRITQERDGWQF